VEPVSADEAGEDTSAVGFVTSLVHLLYRLEIE